MSTTYLDFLETTTSAKVAELDALGLLNFAMLFQERVFVNDTPLGDSNLLIQSYHNRTPLFTHVVEFLKSRFLCAHIRSQVSIGQNTLYRDDEIFTEQTYKGWLEREKQLGNNLNTAAFTCPIHGHIRYDYHRELDKTLREVPVFRYKPDEVKFGFREQTKALLQDPVKFGELTGALSDDTQRLIGDVLNSPFFTLRDIYWPLRERDEAQNLIRSLAFINQRSYAVTALAAPLGTNQSGLANGEIDLALATNIDNVEVVLAPPEHAPKSVKEFFESATITLPFPSIKLLAKLTPDQVLALRHVADNTVFATSWDLDNQGDPNRFISRYGQSLKEYVSEIHGCLARWHRHDTLTISRSNAALGWGGIARHAARECWSGRWDAAAVSVRSTSGVKAVARTLLDRKENAEGVTGKYVGGAIGATVGALVSGVDGAVAGGVAGKLAGAYVEPKIAKGVNSFLDYFMVLVCDRSDAARGILSIPDTWDSHVHVAGLDVKYSEPRSQ